MRELRLSVKLYLRISLACCMMDKRQALYILNPVPTHSVLELPILVLAKQCLADGGESLGLEKLQSLFEGVVDIDFAVAVEDNDAARS